MELNQEFVVNLLLAAVAAGIVVTKIVDGLKARGELNEGKAGQYNQVVSSIVAVAVLLLTYYFGEGARVPEAQEVGLMLAASPILAYVIAGLAWIFHQGIRVINGLVFRKSPAG